MDLVATTISAVKSIFQSRCPKMVERSFELDVSECTRYYQTSTDILATLRISSQEVVVVWQIRIHSSGLIEEVGVKKLSHIEELEVPIKIQNIENRIEDILNLKPFTGPALELVRNPNEILLEPEDPRCKFTKLFSRVYLEDDVFDSDLFGLNEEADLEELSKFILGAMNARP